MTKKVKRAVDIFVDEFIYYQGQTGRIVEKISTSTYIEFGVQLSDGRIEDFNTPPDADLIVYEQNDEDILEVISKEKFAFICSPYAGDTKRNINYANECCKEALKRGYIPIAPHLYFPQFLDDQDPEQREFGLALGRNAMKEKCEIVFVGDKYGISNGMKGDISFAEENGISIEYLSSIKGYSNTEITFAIKLVFLMIATENLSLEVFEYGNDSLSTELKFNLFYDLENCLLDCDNLFKIICYLKDFSDINTVKETCKSIWLSKYFKDILTQITASVYSDYVATGFGKNQNLIDTNFIYKK